MKHHFVITPLFAGLLFACSSQRASLPVEQPSSQPAVIAAPPAITFNTKQGTVSFIVEVAKTRAQQSKGLMDRAVLLPDRGMLFVFPDSRVRSFWMKNTHISLDIIFMDENWRVVGVIERTKPESTTSLTVDKKSRYVLEVNGGMAGANAIDIGTQAKFDEGR